MAENPNSKLEPKIESSLPVDLGDDLLEGATRVVFAEPKKPTAPTVGSTIEGLIHDAQILCNEKIFAEAKKKLLRVLSLDSKHARAIALLQKIEGIEERRENAKAAEPSVAPMSRFESEKLIENLERDLGISGTESSQIPRFTIGHEGYEKAAMGLSHRDRIDLGISLKEMGLYEQAAEYLEAAIEKLLVELNPATHQEVIEATSLLADLYLEAKRVFEARMVLEPLVRDSGIRPSEKLELFYLMGKSCLALGKDDEAFVWFEQVSKQEPDYRDLKELIRNATRS